MRNRNKKLNIAIWMTIVMTTILLLLTGGVLAMRYGNFMPRDADVIFLVPRTPSMSTEDDKVNWEDAETIEIFQTQQVNADGDVVVQSAKNDDVIAPGSKGSYTFYLRNEGNVALDYNISFTAKLTSENIRLSAENFPFLFRMYDQTGKYAVGGEETWVTADEINDVLHDGIVGKGSFFHYTLEWYWPFENGDDGMDTYFGNLSAERDVVLSLDISSYAEESTNPNATGGEIDKINKPAPEVGDINPITFVALMVATLLSILLLIYLLYRRFVKRRNRIPYGVLATTMAGVGSTLSVMFVRMFSKQKKNKKK